LSTGTRDDNGNNAVVVVGRPAAVIFRRNTVGERIKGEKDGISVRAVFGIRKRRGRSTISEKDGGRIFPVRMGKFATTRRLRRARRSIDDALFTYTGIMAAVVGVPDFRAPLTTENERAPF